MDIKIYNTLTRKIEIFKPLKAGAVSMYNCGPTVYDTPHVGNYRTFVYNDIFRRVFEYNTFKVNQVMNITDVDDKTIKKSQTEGVNLKQITQKYEKMFLEGLESLNIMRPHKLVRATENIQLMIDLVNKLLEKNLAYKTDDGVYMSVAKVKNYGQLAGLESDKENQTSNKRHAKDEYDKENPDDFALWKFQTPDDGECVWSAPFGQGRPGWHIECSAMSMNELGPTIDIHTGGVDLIFPHHTNEIAQSESVTDMPFVKYWLHIAFMTVNTEKMAKSKNNFIKLEDLAEQNISPLSFRYWLLTAHYRTPVDFSFEAVKGSQNALIRLISAVSGYPNGGSVINEYKQKFIEYINDDINMPKAVALIWELLKNPQFSDGDKKATILDFDKVFGLKLNQVPLIEDENIPQEITAIAEARQQARTAKDWSKADALRLEAEKRGYLIKDTDIGFKIEKI